MSKYTPGPWKATQNRVTAPETEDRLELRVQINGGNRDDNKANARLIAAAPDLLEALQVIVENGGIGPEDMFDDARDAIAKALGTRP